VAREALLREYRTGLLIESAVRDALRLALGRAQWSVGDWTSVLEVARVERLLGIAWLRSGAGIRAIAPASVVATWRAAALQLDERARAQLETLARLSDLLRSHGATAIILKGPPLSTRLYGEPGVRHSVDLDLLVAASARFTTRQALEAAGWIKWLGDAPWDECFYRRQGGAVEYLEVHSHLLGEALSHCGPLRLETHPVATSVGELDAAGGAALPVFLAGNMAKHGVIPLSALVDFATLWVSLEAGEREAAIEIARGARLAGCLRWAVDQIRTLNEAAEGRTDALRRLGVHRGARVFGHAYLRLITLADSPADRARIAAAWAWPRPSRGSWRSLGAVWNRRLRKPLHKVGSFRQGYAGG
jgi:putative nucleotidyltransferase-like protein